MIAHNYILLYFSFILTFVQLSQSAVSFLPTYNPSTGCHDLTLTDEDLVFAICLQRGSNKQHPYNLYTSPSFCSRNYPPFGRLLDFFSLSPSTIHLFLQSLTNLFHTKDSHISLPEPQFLWINSNFTGNLTTNPFWCPHQCQGKNQSGKFPILKLRCQFDGNNNHSGPCLTTKQTHWDRAPFICITNQTIRRKKQITSVSTHVSPSYTNDTIVFHDSTSCVIVRTRTHQYTFCFRRQSCPQTLTSAFCTTKSRASHICHEEKNASSLLTIENDDEYQLINDIISQYANETLMNSDGSIKKKYVSRAQWMWIDGIKGINNIYQWNITGSDLTSIRDKYWCDNMTNCFGGKGRDHVVLNIICQSNNSALQVCLASRRESEPGPFICKRALTANEEPVLNYTFVRSPDLQTTVSTFKTPVYERNMTAIYYDEHHCLTVQTHSHLYSFCLRRQNCTLTKAYCTKWSEAQKDCRTLKNHAQLLTIDNDEERQLVTDIIKDHLNETRLTFNGSSYRYYELADYVWIDGIQQIDNRTYLWKDGHESVPTHLWCPKNECNSLERDRVMLNLLCQKKNSFICLGTRMEWEPAPYVCKRVRPPDQCPILFDKMKYNHSIEMLIVAVNRTVALIRCKHPEYITEIRVEYQCDSDTNEWKLIYTNNNFTCPGYDIPPTAVVTNGTQTSTKMTTPTTVSTSYPIQTTSISRTNADCSQTELSLLMAKLPTQLRYINTHRIPVYSSLYYDMKLSCSFNQSIRLVYRCDLSSRQWIYVYGNTNRFQNCSPPCNHSERIELLNKYFTRYEQTKIRTKYLEKYQTLRLRCFHMNENRWKSIDYKCGNMSITTDQWFKLHSCFPPPPVIPTTTTTTTTTTELPPVFVSMSISELPRSCPRAVAYGSRCEYEVGQYIFDSNGCARKICPSLSHLCNTIRCPPDRSCRVIPCRSCIHTEYLQPVCEYPTVPSLCELERRLFSLDNSESINRWLRQTIAVVQQYANEQRQRLRSPWPVLTIH